MSKILIVEDDINYQNFLVESLKAVQHEIIGVSDNPVEILMNYKAYADCDLVITDYMMPAMNGIDFVKYFRRVHPNVKILLLTALEGEEVELAALNIDVDDFLNKKMSVEKLQKYVEKILKNSSNNNIIQDGFLHSNTEKIVVDLEQYKVKKNDSVIDLTRTEYNVLIFFLKNMGKVLSRKEILDSIWEATSEDVSERIIDTHIKLLRRKLKLHCIQSVRGVGYKWDE